MLCMQYPFEEAKYWQVFCHLKILRFFQLGSIRPVHEGSLGRIESLNYDQILLWPLQKVVLRVQES